MNHHSIKPARCRPMVHGQQRSWWRNWWLWDQMPGTQGNTLGIDWGWMDILYYFVKYLVILRLILFFFSCLESQRCWIWTWCSKNFEKNESQKWNHSIKFPVFMFSKDPGWRWCSHLGCTDFERCHGTSDEVPLGDLGQGKLMVQQGSVFFTSYSRRISQCFFHRLYQFILSFVTVLVYRIVY